MNSQSARGAALVAVHVIHYALNETALEFTERFLEQDTAFHHLPDKDFQLVFHNTILRSTAPGGELRAQNAEMLETIPQIARTTSGAKAPSKIGHLSARPFVPPFLRQGRQGELKPCPDKTIRPFQHMLARDLKRERSAIGADGRGKPRPYEGKSNRKAASNLGAQAAVP